MIGFLVPPRMDMAPKREKVIDHWATQYLFYMQSTKRSLMMKIYRRKKQSNIGLKPIGQNKQNP